MNKIVESSCRDADSIRKLYLQIYLNNNQKYVPIYGMVDTGSDVSILGLPFLERFFKGSKWRTKIKKDNQNLVSFTETKIQVVGEITLQFKLKPNHVPKRHKFIIVQNPPAQILLGADIIQENKLFLDYSSVPPSIYVKDKQNPLTSIHMPPHQINRITIHATLEANETKAVPIALPNDLINVFQTDRILINEELNENFMLFPSTSSQEENVIYCLISNLKDDKQIINHEVQIDTVNPNNLVYQFKKDREEKILVESPVVYHDKLKPYLPTLPEKTLKKHVITKGEHTSNTYYVDKDVSSNYDLPYQFEESVFNENNSVEPDSPLCEDFCPQGYELPPSEIPTVSSKISEMDNPPKIDKYVRDIFYKYGSVISRFSLDVGDISRTIGMYSLSLKPKAYFPTVHRSYFLHPEKKAHMDTILQFMIKHKIIRKANEEDIQKCRYSSPCFLTTRANKESPHRLLIDFRFLNAQLSFLPPIMPRLDDLLNGLRGAYYFSVVDLNQAFLQFSVDKASQPYTRFFYNQRSYVHLRLPMGWAGSPGYFQSAIEEIIEKEPVFDESGQLVYEEDGSAKLIHNPLVNSRPYLDDIITCSPFERNPDYSLKLHFQYVEQLMERLAKHSVKISLEKSQFAKTSISYLGFLISHNTIVCNPKRIDKLLSSPLPTNKRGLRNMLGLLNSVRQYTDNSIAKYINVLSPLTSIKADFKLEPRHIEAIKQIKRLMVSQPIFGYMISKTAPKILFSDASGSVNGHLSSVLCQVISTETELPFPSCLSPSDPVHEIIIKDRLPVEPLLFDHEKGGVTKANKVDLPVPYLDYLSNPYLGFKENDVNDSLMLSLKAIQKHGKNGEFNEPKMRSETVKFIKSKSLHLKLAEDQFEGNMNKCLQFIEDFKQGKEADQHEILLEGIAKYLRRKIYVIDGTPNAKAALIGINEELYTSPWYIGKYLHKGRIIYRPYINVRFEAAKLDHLNKKLELIAFYSKSLGKDQSSKSIIELEALSVVHSLKKFEEYLTNCDVTLYCDNKSFFSLFLQDHTNFNIPHKLLRYATYIRTSFPRLNMRFLNSEAQLADFISRAYKTYPRQLKTLKMNEIRISDKLDQLTPIDKTFTIDEFQKLVKNNQQTLLEVHNVNKKQILEVSFSNNQLQEKSYLDSIFNERLSRSNIIKEQKIEFTYYINKCLASDEFTYIRDQIQYKLVNNLLMVCTKGHLAILVPEVLIGYLISYVHLKNGHAGLQGCLHNLSIYSFPNKKQRVMDLIRACYSCFFVSPNSNLMVKNNFLPPPSFVGETWYADYAESLPPDNGFKHILIFVCGLSNLTMAFPRKTLTTQSLIHDFLYSVYPYFPVKTLICDNGSTFASKDFNELCHSLNINKPRLSSLSPRANKCEIFVGKIKRLLRKMSVESKSQSWLTNLSLVLRVLNTQVQSPKKLAPLHFLFGSEMSATRINLVDAPFNKQSDLINDYSYVENRTIENKKAVEFLRKELALAAEEKIEKRPIIKHGEKLKKMDIVFVRKLYYPTGTSRALLTKFSRDPFVVLEATDQAAVVRRLADGFITKFDTRNLKLFKRDDIDFALIPPAIKSIIMKGFENLTALDLKLIRQESAFDEFSGAIARDEPKSHPLDQIEIEKYRNHPDDLSIHDILPPSEEELKENLEKNSNQTIEGQGKISKDDANKLREISNERAPNNQSNDDMPQAEINEPTANLNENIEMPINVPSNEMTINNQSDSNPKPLMIKDQTKNNAELNIPKTSSNNLNPPPIKDAILSPTGDETGPEFNKLPSKAEYQPNEILDEIYPQYNSDPKENVKSFKVAVPKPKIKPKPKFIAQKEPIMTRSRTKNNKIEEISDSDEETNEKNVTFDIPDSPDPEKGDQENID